jgi:hypothetical protein
MTGPSVGPTLSAGLQVYKVWIRAVKLEKALSSSGVWLLHYIGVWILFSRLSHTLISIYDLHNRNCAEVRINEEGTGEDDEMRPSEPGDSEVNKPPGKTKPDKTKPPGKKTKTAKRSKKKKTKNKIAQDQHKKHDRIITHPYGKN